MFYLHTKIGDHHNVNLYASDYHTFMKRAKFPRGTEIIDLVIFKASGKTYAEQKESARQIAIDFQHADVCGLSWNELAEISNYFQRVGKHYGLFEEFRENGIC